jgi:integrase/recombinase XerC
VFVADSRSGALSLVPPGPARDAEPSACPAEPGLADVVTLQRRRAAGTSTEDEQGFFLDTLAEYEWARDVAGLAASTLDRLVKPVVEICGHYGVAAWRLTPRQVDKYFAGPGKRGRSTVRQKLNLLDSYFAFLEQRYAGEISRRFGIAVESPVDAFNRPRHRGDFGLRVPPSPASGAGSWSTAKGARGSGPRQREAYLFEEGRALLWWYLEEVRGKFCDDPEDLIAPLFPSERIPPAVAALTVAMPGVAVAPSTFRRALKTAGHRFLTGPVRDLHPHLLRHACATHNYQRGMSLWEVQKLLGHDRPTTTVQYLATAQADPEKAGLAAAGRAVQRLVMDKGNLR